MFLKNRRIFYVITQKKVIPITQKKKLGIK